jgi:hypothetical protein
MEIDDFEIEEFKKNNVVFPLHQCYNGCKRKVEEIREDLKRPEYIESAIDFLAEKMAASWIKEKYGK